MNEQFVASFDDATSTLTLTGIVDELSLDEMKDAVRAATHDHTTPATIDLSGLAFLPSVGLGVLAVALRKGRQAGAAVTITTVPGSLSHRVLDLSGLPFELR